MIRAYFYHCETCGLGFPSLEPLERCPRCAGVVRLRSTRLLPSEAEREGYANPLQPPVVGVVDNVRSAWNVGGLFRVADAAGLSHLYLCGITPVPPHPGIAKTALGAEEAVPWSYHPDAVDLVKTLRQQGWTLWALETEGATTCWHPSLPRPEKPLALVVGNERAGVTPQVLELCQQVLYVPMRGRKRSLNVTAAFAVVAMGLGGCPEES